MLTQEFSSALLLLLVFLLCLFRLHSLHKIIKLVSFWSAWPKDWVYLKLQEEILNEVYSHRGVAKDAASFQTQSFWIYEAKEMGFVQTFNGFHARSLVMSYISPQVLFDKTDSFSIRSIWIQRIRVCALHIAYCYMCTTAFIFVYAKFYLICQAERNHPSFCRHSAFKPSFIVWTSEEIVIIRLYRIVSCNRDEACLLRGPNWIFI